MDRRFTKSVTLVGVEHAQADTPPAEAVEIDVHRTLCDGVFGTRIPLDHLHATTVVLELGGIELRALGPTQRTNSTWRTTWWSGRRRRACPTSARSPSTDRRAIARRARGGSTPMAR